MDIFSPSWWGRFGRDIQRGNFREEEDGNVGVRSHTVDGTGGFRGPEGPGIAHRIDDLEEEPPIATLMGLRLLSDAFLLDDADTFLDTRHPPVLCKD